jgi:hypothetical protein
MVFTDTRNAMPENFLNLKPSARKEIITAGAAELGMPVYKNGKYDSGYKNRNELTQKGG